MQLLRTTECPRCGYHRLYCRKQYATFVGGEWQSFTRYAAWLQGEYPELAKASELECLSCRHAVAIAAV